MSRIEITSDMAIKMAEDRFWEHLSPDDAVTFQLQTDTLCIPIDVYQRLLEDVLGRPVFTHELRNPEALLSELYGSTPPPSSRQIMAYLAEHTDIITIDALTTARDAAWPEGEG